MRVAAALTVIHRNLGNKGLLRVLDKMGITNNDITFPTLKKMDVIKQKKLVIKNLPKTTLGRLYVGRAREAGSKRQSERSNLQRSRRLGSKRHPTGFAHDASLDAMPATEHAKRSIRAR